MIDFKNLGYPIFLFASASNTVSYLLLFTSAIFVLQIQLITTLSQRKFKLLIVFYFYCLYIFLYPNFFLCKIWISQLTFLEEKLTTNIFMLCSKTLIQLQLARGMTCFTMVTLRYPQLLCCHIQWARKKSLLTAFDFVKTYFKNITKLVKTVSIFPVIFSSTTVTYYYKNLNEKLCNGTVMM